MALSKFQQVFIGVKLNFHGAPFSDKPARLLYSLKMKINLKNFSPLFSTLGKHFEFLRSIELRLKELEYDISIDSFQLLTVVPDFALITKDIGNRQLQNSQLTQRNRITN